jgi:hypothetical protein
MISARNPVVNDPNMAKQRDWVAEWMPVRYSSSSAAVLYVVSRILLLSGMVTSPKSHFEAHATKSPTVISSTERDQLLFKLEWPTHLNKIAFIYLR